MDIQECTLWQVGAGDTDRRYDHICIAFDVMIMGPGDPGQYEAERYCHLGRKANTLRRFYEEAAPGDLVLLRIGTGEICALGMLTNDVASHQDAFSDVDGWDLQHTRRVRWFPGTAKIFPPKTLGGQVSTFATVNVESVRKWVAEQSIPENELNRDLKPLPKHGMEISDQDLGQELFQLGEESNRIESLLETLAEIRRVANWYSDSDEHRPSESETISHLVVPLLASLGWSQQLMAVEWDKLDIALFGALPRVNANLECIIEAKLLSRSVFRAFDQAERYALAPGRENCTRLIVTDGIRYATYRRESEGFKINSYMNLLDMRTTYPIFGCGGCVDAIRTIARIPVSSLRPAD